MIFANFPKGEYGFIRLRPNTLSAGADCRYEGQGVNGPQIAIAQAG